MKHPDKEETRHTFRRRVIGQGQMSRLLKSVSFYSTNDPLSVTKLAPIKINGGSGAHCFKYVKQ